MSYYLIVSKSLTHAQKTARALERAGIAAIISRPPRSVTEEGCGYCVKIPEKRLADALIALNNAGIGHGRTILAPEGGREVRT